MGPRGDGGRQHHRRLGCRREGRGGDLQNRLGTPGVLGPAPDRQPQPRCSSCCCCCCSRCQGGPEAGHSPTLQPRARPAPPHPRRASHHPCLSPSLPLAPAHRGPPPVPAPHFAADPACWWCPRNRTITAGATGPLLPKKKKKKRRLKLVQDRQVRRGTLPSWPQPAPLGLGGVTPFIPHPEME